VFFPIANDQNTSLMAEFITVAKVGDIPEGQGVAYPVNGRMVAVFNDQGNYFAIDDFCPHMGASLAGGWLEKGIVTCPWHAWRFCVHDGQWCDNPRIKISAFPVRVVEGEIQVQVEPKAP
jgi:nitrite reductase (NADH) small subunit/3-phenylpropionate/trans-cinnamate dioxygenase ferredoxin subunit